MPITKQGLNNSKKQRSSCNTSGVMRLSYSVKDELSTREGNRYPKTSIGSLEGAFRYRWKQQ